MMTLCQWALTAADYTVPAIEVDIAEVRQTFETNLFAVITMCQTFLPLLIKAKGTIVQIGSIAGVSLRHYLQHPTRT